MEEYSKKIFRIQKKCNEWIVISQRDISHLNKRGVDAEYKELLKSFPESDYQIVEIKSNQELRLF